MLCNALFMEAMEYLFGVLMPVLLRLGSPDPVSFSKSWTAARGMIPVPVLFLLVLPTSFTVWALTHDTAVILFSWSRCTHRV